MVQEQPGSYNWTKFEQFNNWSGLEINCVEHKFQSLVLGSVPGERNDALNSNFLFSLLCPFGVHSCKEVLQDPPASWAEFNWTNKE